MIKIRLEKPTVAEKEYFDLLKPHVLNRLNILKISLLHLTGGKIDVDDPLFASIKVVTRKIVNMMSPGDFEKKAFNKGSYSKTVTDYMVATGKSSKIKLSGLLDLTDSLTQENNLSTLITCKAENLEKYKDKLLSDYKLSEGDAPIMGLAFDYEFSEINEKIKGFFRDKNFVKYCPYCNLKEIEYLETDAGDTADVHELDHFFDKKKSPLLAFSMYNLVPSDSTCNGRINKGSIPFYEEYHLNPYMSGAGNHIQFQPKLGSVGEVLEVEIFVNSIDLHFRKKLIGNSSDIDETSELGNVNVFKLKTRYKNKTKEVNKLLKKIENEENGRRSIEEFLSELELLRHEENYLKWYHENIDTAFSPNDFHLERYSKLNRDIHDYYYLKDIKAQNQFIRDLILKNQG